MDFPKIQKRIWNTKEKAKKIQSKESRTRREGYKRGEQQKDCGGYPLDET